MSEYNRYGRHSGEFNYSSSRPDYSSNRWRSRSSAPYYGTRTFDYTSSPVTSSVPTSGLYTPSRRTSPHERPDMYSDSSRYEYTPGRTDDSTGSSRYRYSSSGRRDYSDRNLSPSRYSGSYRRDYSSSNPDRSSGFNDYSAKEGYPRGRPALSEEDRRDRDREWAEIQLSGADRIGTANLDSSIRTADFGLYSNVNTLRRLGATADAALNKRNKSHRR